MIVERMFVAAVALLCAVLAMQHLPWFAGSIYLQLCGMTAIAAVAGLRIRATTSDSRR